MLSTYRWATTILVLSSIFLASCGLISVPVTGAEKVEPSVVEPIEGSKFSRVLLTEKAAKRLDIQTVPVLMKEMNGTEQKVIPYAAVMYGLNGETWTYTNPEPLVYVRQTIVIDHIVGDTAVLLEGPDVDTPVVSVGAALLYGAEVGVSK